MFDGFADETVDLGAVRVRVRRSPPAGPAVVLLHGHPRTGATWHRVAPLLHAAGYAVVCPDLRGYGRSSKPTTTPDHAPYAKRAMAADVHALMTRLGHDRFAVVGHDRGAYVASRLALDRPDAVAALAVLDAVPIAEALDRCTDRFATAWWHWFFFARPDLPEQAILAEADRAAGRRITCPFLVLWSRHDDLAELFGDPVAVWRPWAADLRGGQEIDSGHHMAEDAPEELADALTRFLPAASS